MKKLMIATLGCAALAMPASASTPGSWAAMNTRAKRACVAMSGLANPVLLAKRISFSDTIGVEMIMLRGADNNGRVKRLLCAYRRSNGRTEVQEADAWNGPTTRP